MRLGSSAPRLVGQQRCSHARARLSIKRSFGSYRPISRNRAARFVQLTKSSSVCVAERRRRGRGLIGAPAASSGGRRVQMGRAQWNLPSLSDPLGLPAGVTGLSRRAVYVPPTSRLPPRLSCSRRGRVGHGRHSSYDRGEVSAARLFRESLLCCRVVDLDRRRFNQNLLKLFRHKYHFGSFSALKKYSALFEAVQALHIVDHFSSHHNL